MQIELLQGVEADLLEVYIRFEEQSPGKGDRFYVDAALDQLRRFPVMAPIYRGPYRRLVLRAFRLGVFYTIASERVMVGAFLDLRENPETIERRLRR